MGIFDRLRRGQEEKPQVRREYGASGTTNVGGYLSPSEYNRELVGEQGLRTFRQMRISDASVRESLWHVFAPILNADWDVEPPEEAEEVELEATALLRAAYFEWMSQPFSEFLRQALLYLPQGSSVFETPWQLVDRPYQIAKPQQPKKASDPPDDGREVPQSKDLLTFSGQRLVWRRFAQRLPETITKWNVENGELQSIVQFALKDGDWKELEIPAEDLLVLTNEREGDDLTGLSVLRSAYKPWFLKELIERVAGASYERHGVGINTAYVPASRADDAETMGIVENMMRDIRAGDSNYLVFPGPKAEASASQGGDGYFFEIVSPSGGIPDFVNMLEYLRGEIKGNVLARFSELGHGSTGARATGDVQSEVWYAVLHAIAEHICDTLQPLNERLVRANLDVERVPRLVVRDIEARNLTDYAHSIAEGVNSGAIEPDRSFRAAFREGLDLPPEDDPEGTEDRRTAPPLLPPGFEDEDGPEPKPPNPPREPRPRPPRE